MSFLVRRGFIRPFVRVWVWLGWREVSSWQPIRRCALAECPKLGWHPTKALAAVKLCCTAPRLSPTLPCSPYALKAWAGGVWGALNPNWQKDIPYQIMSCSTSKAQWKGWGKIIFFFPIGCAEAQLPRKWIKIFLPMGNIEGIPLLSLSVQLLLSLLSWSTNLLNFFCFLPITPESRMSRRVSTG